MSLHERENIRRTAARAVAPSRESARRRGSRSIAVAVATTAYAVSTVLAGPPAGATTGTGYDGQSPVSTGCATGASPIWSGSVVGSRGALGEVQVMYSPRCGTNWVRSRSSIGTVWQNKEVIRNLQPGHSFFRERENDYASGWTYSMMVHAPGSTSIRFTVIFKSASGTILGSRGGQLS